MRFLLALHLLFAVFAVGPLVHAVTTAARGVRRGDATLTAGSARTARVYSYASALVVVIGFGLMSTKEDGKKLGEFGDTWIWVSLLLWIAATAVTLGVVVTGLDRVTAAIGREESVVAHTARIAAAGGVVGLLYAVIVFLMVYRPGA